MEIISVDGCIGSCKKQLIAKMQNIYNDIVIHITSHPQDHPEPYELTNLNGEKMKIINENFPRIGFCFDNTFAPSKELIDYYDTANNSLEDFELYLLKQRHDTEHMFLEIGFFDYLVCNRTVSSALPFIKTLFEKDKINFYLYHTLKTAILKNTHPVSEIWFVQPTNFAIDFFYKNIKARNIPNEDKYATKDFLKDLCLNQLLWLVTYKSEMNCDNCGISTILKTVSPKQYSIHEIAADLLYDLFEKHKIKKDLQENDRFPG